MSIQLSPASFLQLLKQSRLLPADQLARVDAAFRDQSDRSSDAQAMAARLVRQGWITQWQADKLLQARHRGFFLGPYRLREKIARGGMSSIYAAEHTETGQLLALKVLPLARVDKESYLPRFRREAAVAMRLQHPNIVRVFDLHTETDGQDDVHFMAMELLKGRDLCEVVNAGGPLPCRAAADAIRQAAEGLAFAHQAGLVHRDIKPGNLFLADDHVVRLLDLGLAQDFDSQENLTRQFDERVLGTADYVAPEQAVDSHTVDSRADIYSLGCSFYFLLTGQPPFTEGTLMQRIMAHQTKTPPPITQFREDVPATLLDLLTGMLQKNRNHRIQTAREVADRLQAWLDSAAGELRFDQRPPRPASQIGRPGSAGVSDSAATEPPPDVSRDVPTDSICSSDTTSIRGEEPKPPSPYLPEFARFLEQLDAETGISSVVHQHVRQAQHSAMADKLPANAPGCQHATGRPSPRSTGDPSSSEHLDAAPDAPRPRPWVSVLWIAILLLTATAVAGIWLSSTTH